MGTAPDEVVDTFASLAAEAGEGSAGAPDAGGPAFGPDDVRTLLRIDDGGFSCGVACDVVDAGVAVVAGIGAGAAGLRGARMTGTGTL